MAARGGRRGGARGDPRPHDARGRAELRRPARDGRAAPPRGARPGVAPPASSTRRCARAPTSPFLLELLGRPAEAIDEAYRGIAEAREADLGAVYGNLLGGNVAGVLVVVGRWAEGRELLPRARSTGARPAAPPSTRSSTSRTSRSRRRRARRRRGSSAGCSSSSRPAATTSSPCPAYQATAAMAMWSGDLADARRAAERGWARLKGSEDWVLDRAHGGDVDGGRGGDRRRGAREAADRRRGGVARARQAGSWPRPRPRSPAPARRTRGARRRAGGEPRHRPRVPRAASSGATIPRRWADARGALAARSASRIGWRWPAGARPRRS